MDSILDPFRREVQAFLERHQMSAEQFGRLAAEDPEFCDKLFSRTRSFQSARLDQIRDWMQAQDRESPATVGNGAPHGVQAPPPPRYAPEPHAPRDGTYGEFDYDRRIEIYKVMVDSTERGIDRRHALNRFYFSVIVAIFVSISFVLRSPDHGLPTGLMVSAALVLGFLNSVLWLSMIFAARRLSASKYDVLNELERELDFAPFTREWQIHTVKGRNFPQFTLIEIILPAALACICLVLFGLIALGLVAL